MLLHEMGGPADHATDHEQRYEQIGIEAKIMEESRRRPIEARQDVLFVPDGTFDGGGHFFEILVPGFFGEVAAIGREQFGSRVTGSIDAMPESGESFVLSQHGLHDGRSGNGCSDRFEDVDERVEATIRATNVEGANSCSAERIRKALQARSAIGVGS